MKDDKYRTLIDGSQVLIGGSTFDALIGRTSKSGQRAKYRNARWLRGKIGTFFWLKVDPIIAFRKIEK